MREQGDGNQARRAEQLGQAGGDQDRDDDEEVQHRRGLARSSAGASGGGGTCRRAGARACIGPASAPPGSVSWISPDSAFMPNA